MFWDGFAKYNQENENLNIHQKIRWLAYILVFSLKKKKELSDRGGGMTPLKGDFHISE